MGRVEACRICLITDVKMERIEGSLETNIKSVFGHNVLYSSDLPEFSCYECSALITKFSKFRKKYLMAQSLLFNILQNHGVVTEKHIKEIDREGTKLSSNLSTALIRDRQLVEIKLESDPIADVLEMTVEEERDYSGSDDDAPLHSVKQIEHVNINSTIKKPRANKRNNDIGEYSDKRKKLHGNDFDVTKLTGRADANGVLYLQADDFDTQLPDMDNTIEEYNNPSSEISLKILENQSVMITNQNTILSKLADFSARLQNVTSTDMVSGRHGHKLPTARLDYNAIFIENVKQFDDFENNLKDPEKRQMLRDKYSILFSGRGDRHTCAYLLVDTLFSRKFMTQCSWAGGSRGEESKIPFRAYKNSISFFHEIVHDCDSSFSVMDCYNFFKNILRNSTQRCSSKQLRMSSGKRRPRISRIAKSAEEISLNNT